jgi:thiol:disulfide interchange protein DsbC
MNSMQLPKTIIALLLLLTCFAALAGETEIRLSLQSKFAGIGKLEHIVKTPYANLYEIMVGDKVYYTDELGLYLFDGSIIEVKTRSDLTEQRRHQLFNFDKLPLELALKKVKGNGKRRMAYFTDPQCGYCKKLEKEFSKISDVTLYLFLYPIFPGSEEIVRNVRCAKDPLKTWDELMLKGISPTSVSCKTPTDKVIAFGHDRQVNGTPNMIFVDGTLAPGYLPAEEIEKHLNTTTKN